MFSLLPMLFWAQSEAKQFVPFDMEFTYTKADADNSDPSQSHFYGTGDKLNPDVPKDWTSPVDYRNGTVHIRLEVFGKTSWKRTCQMDPVLHSQQRSGQRI